MPPRGARYVIPFGQQGMLAHQNRWLVRAGELADAAGVTFENDLAQKEPAAAEYDATGLVVHQPLATLSAGQDWQVAAAWMPQIPGTVPVFQDVVASWLAANRASPWAIPVYQSAGVGETVILAIGSRLADAAAPLCTSLVDNRGNTYTRLVTGNASLPDATVELWASTLVAPLTDALGDYWTATFTESDPVDRSCAGIAVSGIQIGTEVADWIQGQETSTAVAASKRAGRSYPALLVAAVTWEAPTSTTISWSGGFTARASAGNGSLPCQTSLATKYVATTPAIVAQYDWASDATASLTGSVATNGGSQVVTGSGTAFLTEVATGDIVSAGGEEQIVSAVSTQNTLTTVEPWSTTQTGAAATVRRGPRIISATTDGGALYRDTPTSGGAGLRGNLDATTLKSGLTISRRRGRFVPGGKEIAANPRKLFYFNGVDEVQVLAGHGSTTTDIGANRPLDWDTVSNALKQPINGVVHRDRLWAFGNLNDAHRLYYSTATDQEDFQGAGGGSLRIASQLGERLYCAVSFRGRLILWKYPRGIFYVVDDDVDYTKWYYQTHSEGLGCAPSPHAALGIDDDIVFLDPHGHLHLFSAVDTLGGVRDSDLTRQLGLHGWVRDTIDTDALEQVVSVWDPQTKTAYFGCRSRTATEVDNDLLLRFDFGLIARNGPVRFSYSRAYYPNALSTKRRNFTGIPAPLIGERSTSMFLDPYASGYHVVQGQTVGVPQTIRFGPIDCADQQPEARTRRKTWIGLEFIFATACLAAQSWTVTVRVDDVVRETLTVTSTNRRVYQTLSVGDGFEIDFTCVADATSTTDIGLVGCVLYYALTGLDQSRVS